MIHPRTVLMVPHEQSTCNSFSMKIGSCLLLGSDSLRGRNIEPIASKRMPDLATPFASLHAGYKILAITGNPSDGILSETDFCRSCAGSTGEIMDAARSSKACWGAFESALVVSLVLARSAMVSVAVENIVGPFFHPMGRTNGRATSFGSPGANPAFSTMLNRTLQTFLDQ